MSENCTIQLYAQGTWHDVASIDLFGAVAEGWRAHTYMGYAVEWALAYPGRIDAHAVAAGLPVGLNPSQQPHWPVFLMDMLPQGFGREELLKRLDLPVTATQSADWALLCAGAGNPIGHLRVKEAAHWLAEQASAPRGYTDAEVARRGEDFAEYLSANGLFVAGSSGVQGEWPKLLLTRADDGLLYLDHTLPDARAREHFIVKFGRGTNQDLARILAHEAPYMRLAARLGLRVHAPLTFIDRALFIPRFDRVVGHGGVTRLAQESIASLAHTAGFGTVPSHDEVCRRLVRVATEGPTEILEYLRRDVANLALGNKDNHARNTALQRDFDGGIRLTPLYDFVPMLLHPDGIARRMRWIDNDAGSPDWSRVLDAVCDQARPVGSESHRPLERARLVDGLKAMAPGLSDIARHGVDLGLEEALHERLRAGIESQVSALEALV